MFSAGGKKPAKKPVTGHSKVMKYANYIKTDSKGGLVIDINAGMWFNYRLSQFLISKMASFDPNITSKRLQNGTQMHSKNMNRPKNSRFRKFLQDFGNFWNVQINLDLKHLHFRPIHHRIWSFLVRKRAISTELSIQTRIFH